MKRVLICGGRDYGKLMPTRPLDHPKRMAERRLLTDTLDHLEIEFGIFQMINGGGSGADALATSWAKEILDAPLARPTPLIFRADWSNITRPGAVVKTRRDGVAYDAAAGPYRNQRMIDEGKPDLVIAFPGGSGTADMVERARKANIEVREVE